MKANYYLLFTLVLAAMTACDSVPGLKPNISGKAGEVVVVYERALWDTTFTKEVKSLIAPIYPALPQREPVFDIVEIPVSSFNRIFEPHRNLVFLQVTPDTVPARIAVQYNVWAEPQTVVRINGSSGDEILALIEQEQDRFIFIIEQAERNRVVNATKRYENRSLRDTVNTLLGGSPYFPNGYRLRKKTDNFVWIDYEIQKAQLGVFAYKYPYKDASDLELENIIAARNKIMKEEVPGSIENSYMTTTTFLPPIARNLIYNNIHFVETRGLWELQNDFMGGPFISHSFYHPNAKDIVVLEAYVYNPRSEKRNFLRQVESIIYSFEWEENQ